MIIFQPTCDSDQITNLPLTPLGFLITPSPDWPVTLSHTQHGTKCSFVWVKLKQANRSINKSTKRSFHFNLQYNTHSSLSLSLSDASLRIFIAYLSRNLNSNFIPFQLIEEEAERVKSKSFSLWNSHSHITNHFWFRSASCRSNRVSHKCSVTTRYRLVFASSIRNSNALCVFIFCRWCLHFVLFCKISALHLRILFDSVVCFGFRKGSLFFIGIDI